MVGFGKIDAVFRGELGDFFVAVEDVHEGEVGVVLGVGILRIALADDFIAVELEGVAEAHLELFGLVEGGTGDADEHDDDAKVDEVTAVTPCIAAG